MDVLILTLFVSLLLVVAGLILFVLRMGAGDFDHGERLSLLPLQSEEPMDSLNEQKTRATKGPGEPMSMSQVRKADPYGS